MQICINANQSYCDHKGEGTPLSKIISRDEWHSLTSSTNFWSMIFKMIGWFLFHVIITKYMCYVTKKMHKK